MLQSRAQRDARLVGAEAAPAHPQLAAINQGQRHARVLLLPGAAEIIVGEQDEAATVQNHTLTRWPPERAVRQAHGATTGLFDQHLDARVAVP